MAEEMHQLSLAERDRRYKAVREAMKKAGLDALLIWGDSGKWDWHAANAHYLAQFGGNGAESLMVFPLEGEPDLSIMTAGPHQIKGWTEYGCWIKDMHGPRGGCPTGSGRPASSGTRWHGPWRVRASGPCPFAG